MENKKKVDERFKSILIKPSENSEIIICACTYCSFSNLDPVALGEKLNGLMAGLELGSGLRIGIAGCLQNCSKVFLKDLGIVAKESAWTVAFGGSDVNDPQYGDIVANGLNDQDVLALVGKCIAYFTAHAQQGEITPQFLQRVGIDAIKEAVL